MGVVASLYDRPVGFVAVHGRDHAAAAGGDEVASYFAAGFRLASKRPEVILQFAEIPEGGKGRDVAAVQQRVNIDLFHAFLVALPYHGDKVRDVGVHVAVGKEPDEMDGRFIVEGVANDLLPAFALIDLLFSDGFRDKARTLVEDTACAHGVVADFAVALVGVTGHADSGAVGLQPGTYLFVVY